VVDVTVVDVTVVDVTMVSSSGSGVDCDSRRLQTLREQPSEYGRTTVPRIRSSGAPPQRTSSPEPAAVASPFTRSTNDETPLLLYGKPFGPLGLVVLVLDGPEEAEGL
jgi:hypothetical protein